MSHLVRSLSNVSHQHYHQQLQQQQQQQQQQTQKQHRSHQSSSSSSSHYHRRSSHHNHHNRHNKQHNRLLSLSPATHAQQHKQRQHSPLPVHLQQQQKQQQQQQQQQQQHQHQHRSVHLASRLTSQSHIDPSLLVHENPNNCGDLASPLPLDQYKLNVDCNPLVVRRKPYEKVCYHQQVAVRYLKPPPPPRAGDVVIREMPTRQVAPAPPLIVRQAPPKPCTPPPLILREAPPKPPCPLPGRLVHVPGKVVPPPARKVIVERLPPIPSKPQQIFIERWLPYGQQTQRVVYQPARPPCLLPDPKNVVIQWESPDVEVIEHCVIRREVKNLGVVYTDPNEYTRRYGASLIRSDQLPDIAHQFANGNGLHLAANTQPSEIPILEGDIHALKLINLESIGLSNYKSSEQYSSRVFSPPSPPLVSHLNQHPAPPTTTIASSIVCNDSITSTGAATAAAVAAASVGTLSAEEEIYLSSYSSSEQQQEQHHQQFTNVTESQESITTQSLLNTLSS